MQLHDIKLSRHHSCYFLFVDALSLIRCSTAVLAACLSARNSGSTWSCDQVQSIADSFQLIDKQHLLLTSKHIQRFCSTNQPSEPTAHWSTNYCLLPPYHHPSPNPRPYTSLPSSSASYFATHPLTCCLHPSLLTSPIFCQITAHPPTTHFPLQPALLTSQPSSARYLPTHTLTSPLQPTLLSSPIFC